VVPKAWSAYSLSNLTGLGSEAEKLFRRKEKKKKGMQRVGRIHVLVCVGVGVCVSYVRHCLKPRTLRYLLDGKTTYNYRMATKNSVLRRV
jgi:hypothetical protein